MAKKPLTKKDYEKSSVDKKADIAGAKKMGISVKKYQSTEEDKKADIAGAKKMGIVNVTKKSKPKVITAMPR